MLENKRSVTSRQLIILLEGLEQDRTLSHERILTATSSKKIHEVKWEQLVARLNAVPNGAKRTVARWKSVLSNWKVTLKKQANNPNILHSHSTVVDDIGRRLLSLVEEEEMFGDLHSNYPDYPNDRDENAPRPRAPKMRSRMMRAGPGREPYKPHQRRARDRKSKYYYDADPDRNNTDRRLMQMQLDRLHTVSQQLESHIQDVQNRIQNIKNMWHHDCFEEE